MNINTDDPNDDPTQEEIDAHELEMALNDLALRFDQLCQARHEAGAAEYGVLTFLGNDVIRMMLEELADTANYCRMQAIKLMLLQNRFEDQAIGSELVTGDDIEIGFQAFKGTKDVGWGGKR